MLTGFAHAAVCVRDIDEATRWYSKVLGLEVLSPPYQVAGEAIERGMGELVPSPVVVRAAIVGLGHDDHVLELIEYPTSGAPAPDRAARPSPARASPMWAWCATTSRAPGQSSRTTASPS